MLERRIRTLVNLNEMQFGFMPGKGTVDAIFIVKIMEEKYKKKDKKLYMCFFDMKKAFDRVPRKVMVWAMRKKSLSEVMVRAVMSLYDGAKKRVRVGTAYSEGFEVKVFCTSRICAVATIVCNSGGCYYRKCKKGLVDELIHADDLVIMSETMEDLKERFWNWKDAPESKGLKVNTRTPKVVASRSEGELFKSKIDSCGVCGRRVMANSMFCTKRGNWVHGKCAKIKRVTATLAMHFVCLKCRGIMVGTMDSIEKMCDEVETVNGFCYLGDKIRC